MWDETFNPSNMTVGQVAGLISVGNSIIQLSLPLLTVVLLVGLVQRQNHNAATWSMISRSLHGTFWPTLLHSDSALTKFVRWRVLLLAYFSFATVLLCAVAGFITPLGLTDSIRKASNTSPVTFEYIRDLSSFGFATPPRSGLPFSRTCGEDHFMNCPGSKFDGWYNDTYLNDTPMVNSSIPQSIYDIFTSGTANSTVSGPFDIQYRQWFHRSNAYVDNYTVFSSGDFRTVETLITRDAVSVVEGLVVDTKKGGIGYRNHTMPANLTYGATWDEDLLWVEPVSQCVDTNLTINFLLSNRYRDKIQDEFNLTDNGGFVDLVKRFDPVKKTGPSRNWTTDGDVPDLLGRARTAAWWSNYFTGRVTGAVMYDGANANLSTWGKLGYNYSSLGQYGGAKLPITVEDDHDHTYNFLRNYSSNLVPDSIALMRIDGQYLFGTGFRWNSINGTNYTRIQQDCEGYSPYRIVNSSMPFVTCSFLYGAPQRTDGGIGTIYDLESAWSQKLYTCASGVRASVKTVRFTYNGTSTLENLQVLRIEDKDYKDPSEYPLWGVEAPKMNGSDVQLLWGIIDKKYEKDPSLRTKRAKEQWVPIGDRLRRLSFTFDSLAASSVFASAWRSAVAEMRNGTAALGSYGGQFNANYGLQSKWRQASTSTKGAESILNLIWTDLVAAASVGTKTGFVAPNGGAADAASGIRDAFTWKRVVEYHDLRYAIPAFIALAIYAVVLILAICFWAFRLFSFGLLNQLMNATSMGRTATNILYRDQCPVDAKSHEWEKRVGHLILPIRFSDSDPVYQSIPNHEASRDVKQPTVTEHELQPFSPPDANLAEIHTAYDPNALYAAGGIASPQPLPSPDQSRDAYSDGFDARTRRPTPPSAQSSYMTSSSHEPFGRSGR